MPSLAFGWRVVDCIVSLVLKFGIISLIFKLESNYHCQKISLAFVVLSICIGDALSV